jgi:serine/threonine protein kinase
MSTPTADAPGPIASESGRAWSAPGYTELRVLGGGGFGEVVLAAHDASGSQVAIKYLHPDLLADPELTALFRAEAATLGQLDSPYVVRLYEYVEAPAGATTIMELVDGVTLSKILESQGKTTVLGALVVLYGSLLGLAAAHERGVVHRDYKPANVLVNGAGASKLTDFGIAALAGDRPMPTGTARYMPPEQFEGAEATPAADVYAATVTFYQCLTGHPPFSGNTTADLYQQHKSGTVQLDLIPPPLRPIVARGLAKDPLYRPANAGRLAAELRNAAGGNFGQDWEDRGRSHLAEAALLLALLWPSGGTSAVAGTTVEQLNDPSRAARHPQSHPHGGTQAHAAAQTHAAAQSQSGSQAHTISQAVRHRWHLFHVRHEEHLTHLRHLASLRREDAVDNGQPAKRVRRFRPRSRLHLAVAGSAAVVTVAVVAGVAVALSSGGSGAGSLTGNWHDQFGNTIQFVSTGSNSWTGQIVDNKTSVCTPINTRLTGSGDSYHGTTAFYVFSGTCGAPDGRGDMTFTIEPNGTKAEVVILNPSGGPYNSGTWTKQ